MNDPSQVPEHLNAEERRDWDEVACTDPVMERLLQTISELRGGLKRLTDVGWMYFPGHGLAGVCCYCNKQSGEAIDKFPHRPYCRILAARKFLDAEGKG